jgi:hypothetical protein
MHCALQGKQHNDAQPSSNRGICHCRLVQVVQGLDVVRAVEAVGSQSGKTSQKVVVKDCGLLQ